MSHFRRSRRWWHAVAFHLPGLHKTLSAAIATSSLTAAQGHAPLLGLGGCHWCKLLPRVLTTSQHRPFHMVVYSEVTPKTAVGVSHVRAALPVTSKSRAGSRICKTILHNKINNIYLLEVPYRLKFIDMYDFSFPPIFRADQIGRIVDFPCNDCFSTEITLPRGVLPANFRG